MVWGCISYDCKSDLITVPMSLNVQRYQQEVLDAAVIPHFDNHPLQHVQYLFDDNARPQRGKAVICNRLLAKQRHRDVTMASKESDLNPVKHLWDYLGRQVQARDPPVRNLQELEQSLHEEWQRIPMELQTSCCQYEKETRICYTCAGRILQILMHLSVMDS